MLFSSKLLLGYTITYILFRFAEYHTVNPLLWAFFFQAPSKGGGGRGLNREGA